LQDLKTDNMANKIIIEISFLPKNQIERLLEEAGF